MNSNKIIAIDLGSSKISTMVAEVKENGAVKIISEESKVSEDVRYGIVEQVSGAAFKVNELIKQLHISDSQLDTQVVSVAIGAKSMKHKTVTISRFVGKPGIVKQDLIDDMLVECRRKIQDADKYVFDIIPLSYLLDGKSFDEPISRKAVQVIGTYNVIYGQAIIKAELDRCFDRTGISTEYSPLAVEALSTVLIEEQEREVGCALINFGATTTTLAIYNEGALQHLLVVPLGSRNITKDIQELGITETNAERLKVLKGTAMSQLVEDPIYVQIPSIIPEEQPVRISTEFLATIIEARLEEITQPIFDVISDLDFPLNAGIVIAGGGAKLNGIVEFVTEKTNLYTRLGDHTDWLTEDTHERFQDPSYSQQIGTIVLTDEYRKEHPVEVTVAEPANKPKIPGSKFRDRLTGGFLSFFGEENKFDDKKDKEEKK